MPLGGMVAFEEPAARLLSRAKGMEMALVGCVHQSNRSQVDGAFAMMHGGGMARVECGLRTGALDSDLAWREVLAATDHNGPLVIGERFERLIPTGRSHPFESVRPAHAANS